MKALLRSLPVIIASLTLSSLLFSQPRVLGDAGENFFSFDALNFYSPDDAASRLDIYIEVPFDKVEFKKSKTSSSNYFSAIDFTLTVLNKNGEVTFNKVYKENIETEKTDIEFLTRNTQIITKNIFLEPGEYTVKISSKEESSKKFFEREKNVLMRDFRSAPLSVSDVMIVAKLVESDGKKYITPLPSRNAGNLDTMYLFFFVYLGKDASSLNVSTRILGSGNEEVFSAQRSADSGKGLESSNEYIIPVPTNSFTNDSYKIELIAATLENSVTELSSVEYRWMFFPGNLEDFDVAIGQLQYIAIDSELKKIRKGKTRSEKQRRFMEFWKSKDPSPNTTRNEVMNEYYKRISYANKTYATHYTEGWKTDMGMIYIIFGLPNNVERHPYEMDTKPYEVWDYYELNRQFIFVDESGFGDYHLVTPIWDTFRFKN